MIVRGCETRLKILWLYQLLKYTMLSDVSLSRLNIISILHSEIFLFGSYFGSRMCETSLQSNPKHTH